MLNMLASLAYCIVGCNTGAPDQQALHVLECDTETGAAKIVQSVTGLLGTTYFALDGHTVGAMTKLCDLPCEAPCHIALSPDEKTLGFAAYSSGTCGIYALGEEAPPPPRLKTFVFPNDAMGPNAKRQKKAFAHQVFFLDSNTMGVVDLGCDRIWFFDAKTMERKQELTITADPGDGPRHVVQSRAEGSDFLYLLSELSSTVTNYKIVDAVSSPRQNEDETSSTTRRGLRVHDNVSFTRVDKQSMLPANFNRWEPDGETLATKAAAIKLTADGKILMASNRGHDSIAFYDVGPTGALTLRNIAKLTGKFPRDFELMPGEKFMVVGHKMSNEIQVYAFDRAACTLTPVGAPIAAWRPLCFKFL